MGGFDIYTYIHLNFRTRGYMKIFRKGNIMAVKKLDINEQDAKRSFNVLVIMPAKYIQALFAQKAIRRNLHTASG